jgi:hypothetical protein
MKSGARMDNKPNNVNRFWPLYRAAAIGSGIGEKNAEWYVNWAEKFGLLIVGKGLRSSSSDDVHRFFYQLERQDGIEQRQVEEARDGRP